jgi:hypothetical protein
VTEPGQAAANEWGRVTADGTAYVRTTDGERVVGSWQADEPQQGLEFFVRRYDDLQTQVALLEQRLSSGATSPDAAAATATTLRQSITSAAAIGDLQGLLTRLDALDTAIERRREERRAARTAALEQARQRKESIAAEAEAIGQSDDWRAGVTRLRDLLTEWKQLPRLDRRTDDELWHRFSVARTAYTRRRKAHFAELTQQRRAAQAEKQAIIAEAEQLATSTDWGPTSAAMRDLMTRWKSAGRAPKDVDDALWTQFRAAQDAFFSAREAANAEQDAQLRSNLEVKRAILVEAEALLPVDDPRTTRARLRGLQDRFAAAGKVPRDAVREVEQRMRAVEQAVDAAAQDSWRRSNPEARARAESTVSQLRESLASLGRDREAAQVAGRSKDVAAADEAIAARRAWLEQAEATLAEFGG